MHNITAVDRSNESVIDNIINQKTKPIGALGLLEPLAKQLALVLSGGNAMDKIKINRPVMLIFAGDHGIAQEAISIAPAAVTQQMVLNFLNGGVAINCFCRSSNMAFEVIDAGILVAIDDPRLTQQSLGNGTHNFSKQAAMSISCVEEGLKLGAAVCYKHIKASSNVIGFGEMGIGNTSSAAAIMAATLQIEAKDCVSRSTDIDDKR